MGLGKGLLGEGKERNGNEMVVREKRRQDRPIREGRQGAT